jgi:putative thioredoxin
MLGPVLEKLEAGADGAWELVKVDIDHEPALAARFRIQSIPAVKGFRDGAVVAEFLGAQPEARVKAFLQSLTPSKADQATTSAVRALEAGNDVLAEQLLREALSDRPDHAGASLRLGELLMRKDRSEEAVSVLATIPLTTSEGRQARALIGRLEFRKEASLLADVNGRISTESPEDAHWAAGTRAAAVGDYRTALDQFLWLAQNNRHYREDGGRRSMLTIFDILGPDDSVSLEYRRKLASALH